MRDIKTCLIRKAPRTHPTPTVQNTASTADPAAADMDISVDMQGETEDDDNDDPKEFDLNRRPGAEVVLCASYATSGTGSDATCPAADVHLAVKDPTAPVLCLVDSGQGTVKRLGLSFEGFTRRVNVESWG